MPESEPFQEGLLFFLWKTNHKITKGLYPKALGPRAFHSLLIKFRFFFSITCLFFGIPWMAISSFSSYFHVDCTREVFFGRSTEKKWRKNHDVNLLSFRDRKVGFFLSLGIWVRQKKFSKICSVRRKISSCWIYGDETWKNLCVWPQELGWPINFYLWFLTQTPAVKQKENWEGVGMLKECLLIFFRGFLGGARKKKPKQNSNFLRGDFTKLLWRYRIIFVKFHFGLNDVLQTEKTLLQRAKEISLIKPQTRYWAEKYVEKFSLQLTANFLFCSDGSWFLHLHFVF